jgi:uncharacterized membrane protein YcfT
LRNKILLFVWVYVLWGVLRALWATFVLGQPMRWIPNFWVQLFEGDTGWFLMTLALLFIVAKAAHRVPAWLQLAVAAVAASIWMLMPIDGGPYTFKGVPLYLIYFLIGVYGRDLLMRNAARITRWTAVAIIATWGALYAVLAAVNLVEFPGLGLLVRLAGLAAGIALATQLRRSVLLRHVGQSTLPIYITHQLWIGALVAVSIGLGLSGAVWAVIAPLVIGLIAFAVAYAIGRLAPLIGAGWLFETPRWLRDPLGAARERRAG